MISLDNVSAKVVIADHDCAIKKLVKEKGAESAEDVLKLIRECPEYDWETTKRNLRRVEKLVFLANKRDSKPEIYFTKGYNDAELFRQDEMNNGNVLLLNNPIYNQISFIGLRNKSIKQIKEDLSHTMPDGMNFISRNRNWYDEGYRNIGSSSLPKIKEALERYEEQVERQAKLTSNRNVNLFRLNEDEKVDIVSRSYGDIIMYLLYNAEARLIWGQLSDNQKKVYLSSAINSSKDDKIAKRNIIACIANYTTLPELEKVDKHNFKVLKRFIEK